MPTKSTTTPSKTVSKSADVIQIDAIASERMLVPVIGTAPLIVNRFSEKAKRMMLDAMQGKKAPREIRDPEADFKNSLYKFPEAAGGGYGFPAVGFKKATVDSARYYGNLAMTELRQFLFFDGQLGVDDQKLVKIEGEPVMREDYVRPTRGADLRYRGMFVEWSAWLDVTYVSIKLSRSSVLSLIDAGGMGVGVGEWRPERKGDFGTYRVNPDQDVKILS